jgi:RNA polymerase-associated protein RTF1
MSLSRPSNVAAEKDRLLKEMAIAESKDDRVDIERIQVRLKELEAYSIQNQNKNAKAMALAEMNKRNRFENFKNASELKPASHARAGEAGYDPFSRRWTRSQNYYDRSSHGEFNESLKEGENAITVAADSGKLTDTKAPSTGDSKLYALHDFDLPINLAGIQKYGGSAPGAHALAFMARKQRLEATCGVPVGNSDGKRHMLSLTVNDYKRRIGLL